MASAQKTLIVTPASIDAMLSNQNKTYVAAVIGKALCGLLQRQTIEEQTMNATVQHNGIGFTGADAHSATLTAKSFQKYGRLLDWQIEAWCKIGKSGHTRLARYHRQLNEIAIQRKQAQLPITQ